MTHQDVANFIWQIADLLRGPYRPPQYERVMLPMTVLRRFDCVLEPTKAEVVKRYKKLMDSGGKAHDAVLNKVAGGGTDIGFHNHSELDFPKLKGDPDNVARHLTDYIAGFSANVRKIFERFAFEKEIELFRQCFTTVDPEAQPVIAKTLVTRRVSEGLSSTAFPRQKLHAKLDAKPLAKLFGIFAAPGGKSFEYEADPNLRDFENVPLKEHIVDYFLREVRPYVADAWIDRNAVDEQDGGIGKVGYEINFNREFFQYQSPRPLKIIDAELATVEKRILALLQEVTE